MQVNLVIMYEPGSNCQVAYQVEDRTHHLSIILYRKVNFMAITQPNETGIKYFAEINFTQKYQCSDMQVSLVIMYEPGSNCDR